MITTIITILFLLIILSPIIILLIAFNKLDHKERKNSEDLVHPYFEHKTVSASRLQPKIIYPLSLKHLSDRREYNVHINQEGILLQLSCTKEIMNKSSIFVSFQNKFNHPLTGAKVAKFKSFKSNKKTLTIYCTGGLVSINGEFCIHFDQLNTRCLNTLVQALHTYSNKTDYQ